MDEHGMTDPRSVRGHASGRQFDPHNAGGLIRSFIREARITSRVVKDLERHVSQFGPERTNAVMIERFRAICHRRIEPNPSPQRILHTRDCVSPSLQNTWL